MKKLVVITGASSGIGKETAIRFSKEGYPLLLIARRKHLMEDLHLPNCICEKVDVTDATGMRNAIQKAESIYGKTDLLINCAGVMLLDNPQTQSFQEWEQMIDVNIKGILTGTHVVLSNMVQNKCGTIINISSIAGRKTFHQHSIYCGSKFAVHAITESIRKEVASSNVRLITIAPGVVETELLSHTSNEQIKEEYNAWKQQIECGLEVQEVVDCIWFAYQMPQNVCIREIVIAKTKQED